MVVTNSTDESRGGLESGGGGKSQLPRKRPNLLIEKGGHTEG